MNKISVDTLCLEIIGYLDVPSVLNLTISSKSNHDIISKFMYKNNNGKKHIIQWCYERKICKQQFFNSCLFMISRRTLTKYGFLRVFYFLEDKFHNTTFSKRVLKYNNDHLKLDDHKINEWSFDHTSFYKKCLMEIHINYENIRILLNRKYKIVLK